MPNPPTMRAQTSSVEDLARPHHTADTVKNTALRSSTRLRPKRSLSIPAASAPQKQPTIADPTTHPSILSDKLNSVVNIVSVPEMTAVSKPNSSPPKAATTQIITR